MDARCVDRLVREAWLPAIPHDGGQKSQVRRRQRSAINRHDAGGRTVRAEVGEAGNRIGVASVWIGDGNNSILCRRTGGWHGCGNLQSDSNQSLLQQKTVSRNFRGHGRDIGVRARGAIDQAKDRIGALAGVEARLHARGADGPAGLRLMAGEASTVVGAEICKEGVLRGLGRTALLCGRDRPRGVGIGLERRNDGRGGLLIAVSIKENPHSLCVSDGTRLPYMVRTVVATVLRNCCYDSSGSAQERNSRTGSPEGVAQRTRRVLHKRRHALPPLSVCRMLVVLAGTSWC